MVFLHCLPQVFPVPPGIVLQAKVQVARACVESRAFHAAGWWPLLPPTWVAKVNAVLMRPLRHMMG